MGERGEIMKRESWHSTGSRETETGLNCRNTHNLPQQVMAALEPRVVGCPGTSLSSLWRSLPRLSRVTHSQERCTEAAKSTPEEAAADFSPSLSCNACMCVRSP